MENYQVPKIGKKFFCIIKKSEVSLAAVISSYVRFDDEYLPMFAFPSVTSAKPLVERTEIDENHLSMTRAIEFDTRVSNALVANGGCDYLILGGLDDDEKSYLTFLKHYNVLEIESVRDVDFALSSLTTNKDYTFCSEVDIYNGLYTSFLDKTLLKIESESKPITYKTKVGSEKGVVVIENNNSISTVIAINYAISIGAMFFIIEPPETDLKEINYLIESWKSEKDEKYYRDLGALLYSKIANIDFSEYEFGTFFTFGAPYSLLLNNSIPFTYVNSSLYPDFFIFNSIVCEKWDPIYSAVVFSPLEFHDEETDFVINKLKEGNYFVRELVGKEASVFNIDHHVKEFPFEIFHICSHGGEVDGYTLKEKFVDSAGDTHEVEYDEVVSFAPQRGEKLIEVTSKYIWRKFDGLPWKSKELDEKKYPHYVFSDMVKELSGKKGVSRKRKPSIQDSCAIKCHDFHYQAMFNSICGSHSHPFIFNNTCWSSSGIADAFLSVGARGYIGTLWAVDNNVAKSTAETFYENMFQGTILYSLQKGMSHSKGTSSENIYIFWGLHFTKLKIGKSIQESKVNVAERLLVSFHRWREQLQSVSDSKVRDMITRLIKWNFNQLSNHFRHEFYNVILPKIKK